MTTPVKFKNIQNVIDSDLCLGCGACAHILPDKINLKFDSSGYLRPAITKELNQDENIKALSVCPGIHVEHPDKLNKLDEMWGPILSAQAGWSTDENIRHRASSGGALTAIACFLLNEKLVDCILHVGVSKNDPLLNEYKISTNADQVAENAGSRYAPAAPLIGLHEALSRHQRIAVIGKPCDIVALKKIGLVDQRIKNQVRYHLAFMCAGVPSIKGTHALLEHLDTKVEQVVEFRYRGNGWPGLAMATRADGSNRSMTYDDSWGKILNKHLQFRCKVCFDGTGEFADISCADAWYGNSDGYPSFEEAKGRSLILARTTSGQELLNAATQKNALNTEFLPTSDLVKIQPYQANRKKLALSRLLAMKMVFKKTPKYNLGSMISLALSAGLKENLKSFGGTLKRLI